MCSKVILFLTFYFSSHLLLRNFFKYFHFIKTPFFIRGRGHEVSGTLFPTIKKSMMKMKTLLSKSGFKPKGIVKRIRLHRNPIRCIPQTKMDTQEDDRLRSILIFWKGYICFQKLYYHIWKRYA